MIGTATELSSFHANNGPFHEITYHVTSYVMYVVWWGAESQPLAESC